MRHASFEHPDWYRALTLRERIAASRRSADAGRTGDADGSGAIDRQRAEARLRRWRADAVFETEGLFEQRLGMDGVDQYDLVRLLGTPAQTIRAEAHARPG